MSMASRITVVFGPIHTLQISAGHILNHLHRHTTKNPGDGVFVLLPDRRLTYGRALRSSAGIE